MRFLIKIVGILSVCSLFTLFPSILFAQSDSYEELKIIEKQTRAESIALDALIQKVYPDYTEVLETVKISKLKIISGQCRVRETIDRSSQIIYAPTVNEEFKIIEHDDNYYHIQIDGSRDGWIHETCGQEITEIIEKSSEPSILLDSDINKYFDFAEIVFEKIEKNKILAERIVEKNDLSKSNSSYKNIQKHYSLAVGIYNKYLKNRKAYVMENFQFEKRFSGSTEILLGKANHYQLFLDGIVTDYDEGNRDFSILGNYIIDGNTRVNISLVTKSEVLQTPYKNKNYGISLNYDGLDKLLLKTGINHSSYDDGITSSNDFGRFKLYTNAYHNLSEKTNLHYNYTFLRNNFKIGDENDYSNHKLSAIGNFKLNEISKVVGSFLANFENSDSEYHQFSNIIPSIVLRKRLGDKRTELKFKYENLTFKELELRSFNRISLSYLLKNRKINNRNSSNLSLGLKTFPNNEIDNYFQIKGKYSSNTVGEKIKRNAITLYTNIYPNDKDNSFTDLRYDYNTISSVFTNLSAYYRLWHNTFASSIDTTSAASPSILDLSGKFGFKVGPVRIGPTVGVHAILDFDEDEVFKQDGNLLRFGGIAEGTFLLPQMINISFMIAYDYGSVYNDELTISTSTGEITTGELQERHPTTLQYSSTISAPLFHNFEIVGRIYYYKINTDMDEKLSINPIRYTEQMSFQFGIRYRYN